MLGRHVYRVHHEGGRWTVAKEGEARPVGEFADCEEALAGRFFGIAVGGIRSCGGGPAPQDLALRDRCQEALARLPAGSGGHRLIRGVLERAERNIRDATQEVEEDDE